MRAIDYLKQYNEIFPKVEKVERLDIESPVELEEEEKPIIEKPIIEKPIVEEKEVDNGNNGSDNGLD